MSRSVPSPESCRKWAVRTLADPIIDEICARHGVTRLEVISPRRQKRLMPCRVEICKALVALYLSDQEIADLMKKDRSMIRHYLAWGKDAR